MSTKVAEYFDKLAPSWDNCNHGSIEEKELFLSPLDIHIGDKILDIGCGTGIITPILASKSGSKVLAIDISSKMIEEAKRKYPDNENLEFRNIDFYELKERGFAWIICHNAYPHFLDKEAFIKKLYDSLEKGGHFAICHSLSRARLSKHHEGEDVSSISRTLLPVEEEIIPFLPYFSIEYTKDDDSSYWIIGKKKD